MTGNAKSEALVRDLSAEELDAVSGGFFGAIFRENQEQLRAAEMFRNILQKAGEL
jgi:hypothetical protein